MRPQTSWEEVDTGGLRGQGGSCRGHAAMALRLFFHLLQMAEGGSLSQEAGNPPCPMAVRCRWPGRGTQPTSFLGDGATSQAHTCRGA